VIRRQPARTIFVAAVGGAASLLLQHAIVPATTTFAWSRVIFALAAVILLVAAERSGFGRGVADSDLPLYPGDRAIDIHDVVQIHPDEPVFGSCLLIVTSVTSPGEAWGVVSGFVPGPMARERGRTPSVYYYRVAINHVRRVGRASWAGDPLAAAVRGHG
jgi:hypothetical protein